MAALYDICPLHAEMQQIILFTTFSQVTWNLLYIYNEYTQSMIKGLPPRWRSPEERHVL